MAKSMTPSAMTDGQIDKAVAVYRDMLRKHCGELGSEAVQRVLGSDDYVNEQVGVLRRRIEGVSDMTDGQIDKAVAAYRDMLRKHRSELGSEATQRMLESDDYVNEQVGVLRRRIEVVIQQRNAAKHQVPLSFHWVPSG